jgi:hypothetical protein
MNGLSWARYFLNGKSEGWDNCCWDPIWWPMVSKNTLDPILNPPHRNYDKVTLIIFSFFKYGFVYLVQTIAKKLKKIIGRYNRKVEGGDNIPNNAFHIKCK